MNLIFLTKQTGFLGPFASIMGVILNAIYELISVVGIHNIAICIVLFTFVIRTLMLPLTIKQQKFSKLSSRMNPELTRLQEKYKDKKDPESQRKYSMELGAVYQKYGTSPMSGCLPMLITIPILYALYRVIYKVPAYINDINDLYSTIAIAVQGIEGYTAAIVEFVKNCGVSVNINDFKEEALTVEHLIDIFTVFNTENWNTFFETEAFGVLSNASVNGLALTDVTSQIIQANSFIAGLNILDIPGFSFPGIIVPLVATALYFAQNKMMTAGVDRSKDIDNPMAQSLNTMNTVMPIMSGIFCAFMPIGVGIYWIAGSVYQIIQQFFINRYMDKIGVDEMIEKNIAKENEKYGIEKGNKMASVAKTTTKSIDNNTSSKNKSSQSTKKKNGGSDYKRREVSYSASNISAIANILKDDEEE